MQEVMLNKLDEDLDKVGPYVCCCCLGVCMYAYVYQGMRLCMCVHILCVRLFFSHAMSSQWAVLAPLFVHRAFLGILAIFS